MEILQRAKQLKDHMAFKKVFITPDLTHKQQEVDKKLRDKLKELRTNGSDEYRIKRGKIVKKTCKEWRKWYTHSNSRY